MTNTSLFPKIKHLFLVIIVCFLVLSIVFYPNHAFDAAQSGADTWFNIVLPSLLPFFIGAELLIGLGIVNFIGILLEPIVRRIFNVPGQGSFVLAMSVTSGYPMGIKLATKLRQQKILSKIEAQRLISFCSTSGPLFMIGAVSIGMFHNKALGTIVAISHYLGAIATGIIFRFYKIRSKSNHFPQSKRNYFSRAFQKMFQSANNQEQTFGALLGSSVKNSFESLLVIGGFIILFSVIIRLLTVMGVIQIFSNFILHSLPFLNMNAKACSALISGIFEMTIGCKLLSEVEGISFIHQAIFSTMIISWSGFSIHAQAASMIGKTDLSIGIYLFSKLIHSVLSSIFVLFMIPMTIPTFNHLSSYNLFLFSQETFYLTWQSKFIYASKYFLITALGIMTIAFLSHILFLGVTALLRFKKK